MPDGEPGCRDGAVGSEIRVEVGWLITEGFVHATQQGHSSASIGVLAMGGQR